MTHYLQTSRSEYRLDIHEYKRRREKEYGTMNVGVPVVIEVFERAKRFWIFPYWKSVYLHSITEWEYLNCFAGGWYGPCMDAVLDYEYQVRTLALEKV